MTRRRVTLPPPGVHRDPTQGKSLPGGHNKGTPSWFSLAWLLLLLSRDVEAEASLPSKSSLSTPEGRGPPLLTPSEQSSSTPSFEIWNTPAPLLADNEAQSSVGSSPRLTTSKSLLNHLLLLQRQQEEEEEEEERSHTRPLRLEVSDSGLDRERIEDAGEPTFTSSPFPRELESNRSENVQSGVVDSHVQSGVRLSQSPLEAKKHPWPFSPGAEEPGYDIRANLGWDERDEVGIPTSESVILNTFQESWNLGGTSFPTPFTASPKTGTEAETPRYSTLGAGPVRRNGTQDALSLRTGKSWREGPVYGLEEIISQKHERGKELVVQDEDEEDWNDRGFQGEEDDATAECQGEEDDATAECQGEEDDATTECQGEEDDATAECQGEDDDATAECQGEEDDATAECQGEEDDATAECQGEEDDATAECQGEDDDATAECQGEEPAENCHNEEEDFSTPPDEPETTDEEPPSLLSNASSRPRRKRSYFFQPPATSTAEVLANPMAFFYRRKRKIEIMEVTVVEGGLAALPCDLDVQNPKDSVQLILWIKEGVHTPLYSYDYRELLGGRPKETKPDANSTLARRTTFRTDSSPAALLVERVEAEDGGVYRCRVDFLLTPTRNKRVNLTVIVPPSRARVSWSLGNSGVMPVEEQIVGPFLEGGEPSLICSNDDGWPPPAVVWCEGDEILDDSYSVDQITVENALVLGPLTRGDLGRRLTCLASNTNKTQPATTTVTLAMTLSIVGVRVDEVASVWAAEKAEVRCKVWGSRPPPTVVWWLGSVMLPPTQTKVMDDGNLTVSILHFTPKPKDDGAMLICQATNEKLPDQAVQDSRLLSVSYLPLVDVRLGRSLDPMRIKEGDDVYFECSVKAKPTIFKVAWKHNDIELVAGAGVFVSNMSLVVQKVTRAHGGNYTCEATNVKGTSSSPPLHLDVKYAPVCARQQKIQHSVAKLENAEISCRVHANPPTVTFRWTFNNTAEAIDVPDGRFVVVGTESRVNYTPMNELDYGTLLCWANNTIGMQDHPCVFHIVAAGKPDPPHNCRVFDVTISSLQVTCLAGDDGGLTQNFLLQVYQIGSTSPVVEVTQTSPSFSLANLRPATAYKILIAAINDKGASRITELKAYTVRVPETREETSAEPTRDRDRSSSVPLAVVIGGIVAAVPLILVIGLLLWLRLFRRSAASGARERRDSTHSKDGASTDLPSEASPPDDRNPDLISHTPDPGEEADQCAEISTITTSSTYFLHNGGPSYNAAAATATPTATPPTVGGGAEYTQLVCPKPLHAHAHTPAVAVSHVPYYPDSQQSQALDLPLPPPASYNQGYPGADRDYQAPATQCYSTLERKRRQQGCPKAFSHPEEYQQGTYDSALQNPFPHLYQGPSGGYCHTPHGSQYNLAQYQGSLAQVPHPIGSPTTQSLQGTLRRGSKKLHKGGLAGTAQQRHHEESILPQDSDTVQSDSNRRREARVCEGVEGGAAGDDSEASTPNTARKSKRESAV